MLVPMTQTSRVRRERRRPGPLLLAAVAVVFGLAIVGFVAAFVGPEIQHRTDSSWHYEQVTLTQCSPNSENTAGISYTCNFATVPPHPFAIDPYLDVTATGRSAPTSTTEWVRVVNGRITGTAANVSLWTLVLLIIPVLMLVGYVRSVRRAHRAGRRWRDRRG